MIDNKYRRVKWALIGAGFFGEMYAQILTSLPNVELVSIFSTDDESLKRVADKFNIKKRSKDFKKIINDGEIEAVAIITIEHHHYEPCMEAIKAGKHIIIEKPLAPRMSEANEMIEAAEKAGVTLAVCHILPFNTHYAIAKNEIENGAVGDIVSAYARRNAPALWGDKIQQHSSAMYDEVVHDLECFLWFTEFTKQKGWKAKRVYGQQINIRGYAKPDINWAAFTFENGCIAVFEANWFIPNSTPYISSMDSQMEIHGTKGMIYIDLGDQGLKINDEKGWRTPDVTWWPKVRGNIEGALGNEIRYLADCIMLGKKPVDNLADPKRAAYALELVLAAEKSAAMNKIIEL
jgi:UDP-N-acetylglucosamine 3-dehydrogenase